MAEHGTPRHRCNISVPPAFVVGRVSPLVSPPLFGGIAPIVSLHSRRAEPAEAEQSRAARQREQPTDRREKEEHNRHRHVQADDWTTGQVRSSVASGPVEGEVSVVG